jgi:hypothetical protein
VGHLGSAGGGGGGDKGAVVMVEGLVEIHLDDQVGALICWC